MRILRYPSLTPTQFLGAASAFWDTLAGALHSAMLNLERLEDRPKGSAFALEMQMDKARYGALIILERWAQFVHAFAGHLELGRDQSILIETPARVQTAENLLVRANHLLDVSERYTPELIAACGLACDAVRGAFEQERKAVEQAAALGPMLPEDYAEARAVFLADLAVR